MLYWAVKLPSKKVIGFAEYPKDQLIFYKGLYGIPSYVIWYATPWPDKTAKTYIGDLFELMIFEAPRKDYQEPDYESVFMVENFYFDVQKSMFKIIAVNRFYLSLINTRMIESVEVGRTDAPVSGIELIKEAVALALKNDMFSAQVIDVGTTDRLKYISVNLDPHIGVLDLITQICKDNGWEYYIGRGKDSSGYDIDTLYVGDQLVSTEYGLPFIPEPENAKIMENTSYMTITTESIWTEPSLLIGENMNRIIWVKYYLGDHGAPMTLMIQKRLGILHYLSESEFIQTLEGYSLELGRNRLYKMMKSDPVSIGKMFGNFDNDYRDNYHSEKFSGDLDTWSKNLSKRSFNITSESHNLLNQNSKMSTPYAGNGVGLLFPQDNSHRLLFSPNGEKDLGIVGPAYFGPEDEVPKRDSSKDFRLQLPGCTLYVKENGESIIQLGVSASTVPSGSGTYIKVGADGIVEILGTNKLSHYDHYHGYKHYHKVGNMGMPIPPIETVEHIPQTGIPIVKTDAHDTTQGTTNTRGD